MSTDTHTDDAPRRARRDDKVDDFAFVGRSVLINRPRPELFAFWRDFQNLPRFMENIQSVRSTGAVVPCGPSRNPWARRSRSRRR